jgi:OHCU decarboxylase
VSERDEGLREGLERLNSLTQVEAARELLKCCGSSRWANRMAARMPFDDFHQMMAEADRIWAGLEPQDWLEAFSHHPKIGEKRAAPAQSAEAARWSEQEQEGASAADDEKLAELTMLNRAYEDRFGYIFIVCATGKTTQEMLALLKERLVDEPDRELRIAAEEQRRITQLRLRKLLEK